MGRREPGRFRSACRRERDPRVCVAMLAVHMVEHVGMTREDAAAALLISPESVDGRV